MSADDIAKGIENLVARAVDVDNIATHGMLRVMMVDGEGNYVPPGFGGGNYAELDHPNVFVEPQSFQDDVQVAGDLSAPTLNGVPAANFARTDAANVFTVSQRINQSPQGSATLHLAQDAADETGLTMLVTGAGGNRFRLYNRPSVSYLIMDSASLTGAGGPYIAIGRNSTAGATAPGTMRLYTGGNVMMTLWVSNNTGNLMMLANGNPTSATENTGTVVGSQSSHESLKENITEASPIEDVLGRIQAAAAHVHGFTYKPGCGIQEPYEGLVLKEDAPETHHYGTNRQEGMTAGQALNEVNLLGDLLRAVAHLLSAREQEVSHVT